jgi:hypothetical protein
VVGLITLEDEGAGINQPVKHYSTHCRHPKMRTHPRRILPFLVYKICQKRSCCEALEKEGKN